MPAFHYRYSESELKKILQNLEMGLTRDIYLTAGVERKNGIDELLESIKDRTRFENELIRASKHPFVLIVEDLEGYQKILNGTYRVSTNQNPY